MTCASCANRIERKLNKLDGVQASVNYATEKARVQAPADLDPAVLVAQVEAAGYTATLPAPPAADDAPRSTEPDPTRPLRDRLVVSAVLAVPVIALAMVPALQFTYWQWISLDARRAGRGVGGVAVPPRGVDEPAARRRRPWTRWSRSGVLAAFGWSLWALVFGTAGEPGMVHPFTLAVARGDAAAADLPGGRGGRHDVPAGRPVLRGTRRSGGPGRRCGRCWSWARRTSRCCATDGRELRVPIDQLAVGDRFVVRPGEKIATDGVVEEGRSAVDAALLTGESVPVEVGPGDAVVGRDRERGRAGWSCAPPGSARTPSSRRWPGWSSEAQSGKAQVQRLADRISAVFVPIVIALAVATLAVLARHRRGCRRGLHRRRRGADHRLPVRARPGHADRAAGRHRPRRQAGHPDQGPGGAGVDPPVDTVVLDKTGTVTTGRMALVEVHVAARRRTRRCGWPGRVEAALGASDGGARSWRPPSPSVGRLPVDARFAERRRASACRASSTATRCWSAARRCSTGGASRCRRCWPGRWPTRSPRADRGGGGVGRRGAGRARGRRHRQADVGRGGRPAARARPASGAADRRQRGGRPSRRRGGRHRRGDRRTCCRRTRWTSSSGCRTRAGSSRWWATA